MRSTGRVVTAVAGATRKREYRLFIFHDAARGTLSLHTCYKKHGTVDDFMGALETRPTSHHPFRPFQFPDLGASFAPKRPGRTFLSEPVPRSPLSRPRDYYPRHRGSDRCCMSHSFLARDLIGYLSTSEHPGQRRSRRTRLT